MDHKPHSRRNKQKIPFAFKSRSQVHEKASIHLTAYGEDSFIKREIHELKELKDILGRYKVVWLHVVGLNDHQLLTELAELFHLHPLAMDAVVETQQRAKTEEYGNQYFLVAHLMEMIGLLKTQQVSLFVSKEFVISLQQGTTNSMASIQQKIEKGIGHIRSKAADYLAYTILDTIIDTYYPVLEQYGDRLEDLEETILDRPDKNAVVHIHNVKRDLLMVRRAIWPLREAVNSLIRDATDIFEEETIVHLRDCYDHTVQVLDFVETYRELGSDLMDVYLSSVSNRMNEVMKVLTVITTIFVPPGLIAGIYGMNFHTDTSRYNMPELTWRYGYIFALTLMFLVTLTTLYLFWHKGWLGEKSPGPKQPHI